MCPPPSPASVALLADSCPAPVAQSLRCIPGCVHSATRFPPATAPVRFAVPDLTPGLSPHSYCVRCTRAAAPRSSWPIPGPCSPAPFVPAPTRLAPGSRSDRPAPSRCDVSPDRATGDRSGPTEPTSAHPADHLSSGSPPINRTLRACATITSCPNPLSARLTQGECIPGCNAIRLHGIAPNTSFIAFGVVPSFCSSTIVPASLKISNV